MTGRAQRERPHVGIFWVVQTTDGEARLLAAGCALDRAEPYGDCLTYGPGHYETWTQWRRDRTGDPALRALVRSHEYEDWPRGRIVFDRSRDLFIIYADRKLLTPATIARVKTQFHLPEEHTEVKSDFHYQSNETPNLLRMNAASAGTLGRPSSARWAARRTTHRPKDSSFGVSSPIAAPSPCSIAFSSRHRESAARDRPAPYIVRGKRAEMAGLLISKASSRRLNYQMLQPRCCLPFTLADSH